jgi:hypothetical protein
MTTTPSPAEPLAPPFVKRLQTVLGGTTAVIAAVTAVLLAIPTFRDAVVKAFPAAAGFPRALEWTILATVCVVGVAVFFLGRVRESRLAPGANLRLDRDNPDHLLGRADDVENLRVLCREWPQVHLVGEAGAGKTALLRAGLMPLLKAGGQAVPIYVNAYGQDWVKGPRSALAEALWDALTEDQRKQLGLSGRHAPDNVTAHLGQFRAVLGLLPLLVFDQFDDYQLRHSARFLAGKQKAWLSPGELTRANAFWRDVKQLLHDNHAHGLFVTRADTADGLSSVYFKDEPQVYRLTRLPAYVARDVLVRLTTPAAGAPPAVLDPECGWEGLRERLAHDLEEEGDVLPARIKLALLGLPRLRALTVAAYERHGGLAALEAGYLEGHVREAARASAGLSEEQIRRLLLDLVDRESLKTVEKHLDDLKKVVS